MKTLRIVLVTAAVLLMLLVTAGPGIIRLDVEPALALDGSISGTVTAQGTGSPLSGIDVCAYEPPQEPLWESLVACDTTDALGAYSVGGLPAGDYVVHFRDPAGTYAYEWYDDTPNWQSAEVVSVTAGADTPGIDAALGPGGSMSGTVTAEASGGRLSGIDVCPGKRTPWSSWDLWFACDVTDALGGYRLGGLPTGDYSVELRDPSYTYATEWYNDRPDAPSADLVSVTAGANTPGINAALGSGGSISGTVTDEGTGAPLSGIDVSAYHQQQGPGAPWDFQVERTTTDGAGAYSLRGLRTANYEVYFRDPSGTYAFEWYNDKGWIESGDLVSVTGGSDTPNIDAPLGLGGSISGTVTDESTGEPLPGIAVGALGPGPPWYFWPGFAEADASGAYSQRGLRPGDYVVQFRDSSHAYIGEYYDNRWHSSTADPVTVSAGLDTPGINGALIENVPGLLKIGTLLPFSGSLADFGPQFMRGAELAAKHLNQAGGVLGLPVVLLVEDDQTSPTFGVFRAQSLIADWGVPAIVGAAASVVTIPVAEQVTIPNQVLLISPASTSPAITNLADDDLVFRTVYSDELQGAALAQVAWDQGYRTACTMYINDPYGQGISSSFTQAFEALGGTVQVQVPHGDQSSYLAELTQCTSGNPDVLVALSYPEHGVVYLQEALDNEIIDQFVFSDGLKYQSMFDSLGPANFEGMYGTAPRATPTPEFSSAYEAEYGEPPSLPYIAEIYDAVVSIALAAAAAGSTDSAAIRDALRGVACPPGPSVGSGDSAIAQGLQRAAAGQHLDYEGGTDSVEFTEYGDGARGMVEIWKIESGLIVTDREEPVAAPTDADGDGFAVCVEDYLDTDFLDNCPDGPTDDAWPLDINMDRYITVGGDLLPFRGCIGAQPGDPQWWHRLDLNVDGAITIGGDVILYRDRIGHSCY